MNKKQIVKNVLSRAKQYRDFEDEYYKLTENNVPGSTLFNELVDCVLSDILSVEEMEIIDWFMFDTNFGDHVMSIKFSESDEMKHYSWDEIDLFLNKLFGEQ